MQMKIDFDMNHSLIIVVLLLMPCCCIYSLIIPKSNPVGECSHLSPAEDQTNFYTTKDERVCCMCPAGTRVSDDCSSDNPNSTRCEPCEYNDHVKTYINYEPHSQRECYKDTISCMEHMVAVGGSPTSKARCECRQGYRKVNDLWCEKLPETMQSTPEPTLQSITEKDKDLSTKLSEDEYETTSTLLQGTDEAIQSTILPNQKAVDIYNATTDVHFNKTSNSTDLQFEHTQLNAVNPGIWAFLAMLFIVGFLLVCMWKRGYFKVFPCNDVFQHQQMCDTQVESPTRNTDSTVFQVHQSSKQETHPLMTDADSISVDIDTNREKVTPENYVEAFNPNGNYDESRCCYANQQHAIIHPQEQHTQNDRQGQVENIPANRLTQEQKNKRYDVFMAVAVKITLDHLTIVGRFLLRTIDFDDIYNSAQDSRFEKAMKIFIRSVQINPQLSLNELSDIFGRFEMGYLKDIVDDSLRDDRNVGG